LWLHSLKVAQLLRSAACLHTNQSRSYLNHLVFLERDGTVFLFRSKKARFKGIKLFSARVPPPPRVFGFGWKRVNSKEFWQWYTYWVCGLCRLVLYKKNSISETSALGPEGTGEALLICIWSYFQSLDGLRDRLI